MTILSTKSTTAWAEVDETGRLILPPEVAQRYGLNPGSKVRLDEGNNFVRMHRPVTHLTLSYFKAFKKDLFLEIITYTSVWLSTFTLPAFAPV